MFIFLSFSLGLNSLGFIGETADVRSNTWHQSPFLPSTEGAGGGKSESPVSKEAASWRGLHPSPLCRLRSRGPSHTVTEQGPKTCQGMKGPREAQPSLKTRYKQVLWKAKAPANECDYFTLPVKSNPSQSLMAGCLEWLPSIRRCNWGKLLILWLS